MMCVEITRGTAKLSCERDITEKLYLVFDPFNKYHHFFSKPGWTCGLPVCTGQHGYAFPGKGQFANGVLQVNNSR
jgi:hypothetical protein